MMTAEFTVGETPHYVGPYLIKIIATGRSTQYPGFRRHVNFEHHRATLHRLVLTYDMMDYHIVVVMDNHHVSPIYEITHRLKPNIFPIKY